MKTIKDISIIVLAGLVIYFFFFKQDILPESSKPLWDKITTNKITIDSLKTETIKKDSIISRFKADSLKVAHKYKEDIKRLEGLPHDTIRIISHHYIDTTLSREQTELEIAKMGMELDKCNSITKLQSIQITKLKDLTDDLKVIISKNEENSKAMAELIDGLEQDKKQFKKQLLKTKIVAVAVVAGTVVLAVFAH